MIYGSIVSKKLKITAAKRTWSLSEVKQTEISDSARWLIGIVKCHMRSYLLAPRLELLKLFKCHKATELDSCNFLKLSTVWTIAQLFWQFENENSWVVFRAEKWIRSRLSWTTLDTHSQGLQGGEEIKLSSGCAGHVGSHTIHNSREKKSFCANAKSTFNGRKKIRRVLRCNETAEISAFLRKLFSIIWDFLAHGASTTKLATFLFCWEIFERR